MPLKIFAIMNIIASASTIISAIIISISSRKTTIAKTRSEDHIAAVKDGSNDKELHITMETYSKKNQGWVLMCELSKLILIISTILALTSVSIYAIYNRKAISHGAYDNIQYKQTLSEISQHCKEGYCENLPEIADGNIFIVFTYGNEECEAMHDELTDFLSAYPKNTVYFISSKSNTAKKLFYDSNNDPIIRDNQPMAVYFDNDGTYLSISLNKKLVNGNLLFCKDDLQYLIDHAAERRAS